MALTLTEKGILLLHGIRSQRTPEYAVQNDDEMLANTLNISGKKVVGMLMMDGLLHGNIRARRQALYVRCRRCYHMLVFGFLMLILTMIFGPVIAADIGAISFITGAWLAILGMLFGFIIFGMLDATLVTGRFAVTETPTNDTILALILQDMREGGLRKFWKFWRLKFSPREIAMLREQVAIIKKIEKRLFEEGYLVIGVKGGRILGDSRLVYRMNLERPECQELRDQFRAFLLTDNTWDEQMATLAIFVAPRIFNRRLSSVRDWRQEGWATLFASAEYPVVETRLKAIKAQRDQTMRTQWGTTIYQGLLTIRYGFAM